MSFIVGQQLAFVITNILPSGAKFKSPPTYVSSDPTVILPVADTDGLTAIGTTLKVGTSNVTVTGDGVTRTVTVTVVAPDVVSFDVTVNVVPAPPTLTAKGSPV